MEDRDDVASGNKDDDELIVSSLFSFLSTNFVFVLDGEQILKYKDRMMSLIPEDIRHRFIIGPVREVVETYEQKKRTWTILHN